ncbi:4Fe-4S ferredoxin iron-sulfur binding domain protein [Methanococcus vannielii SB]|uniref:4Fe-4S ferredoxin iron-sulfur binding domain protein n=1 Tax=Methanococcus vannielii (strain ATCC 35089 / DSM 1224 / JCM 13029 / OCM 148 / SB) TaxID=406327 RepID=A6UPX4_METVS|nr:4Fe-4S dicluster domain-containing protein [Methanococcus vannielii]ABR54546.1 4Fe-4S ferredoxin iron-sulfur binding domain protein [Methanococcus vannielii SB]
MSVIIDYNKCKGPECAECVNTCPTEVFEIKENKVIVMRESDCTFCLVCIDVCPTDAIIVKED